MYGTIRMHQELHYPRRISGTMLKNPDFAAMRRPLAAMANASSGRRDFAAAFERALASGKPAILHCIVDPEALTPGRTLTELREAALAKK